MGKAAGEVGRENELLGGSCPGEYKYSHRKCQGQLQRKKESLEENNSFFMRTEVKRSGEEEKQQQCIGCA